MKMKFFKLVLIAFGFVIVAFTAAPASASPITGTGPLNILGKCLDAPGWNGADGTGVQIYDCNGGTNQEWELWSDNTIRPAFDTNKCLDLPGWQTNNGTPINLWDCNGGTNQQWNLDSSGTLTGFGGKCIDDPSGQTDNGTSFQYYDCNGGFNQSFSLGATVAPPVALSWNVSLNVGGNVNLTIFADGSYDFSGSFHDSGFWDYDIGVACIAKDTNGQAYSFTASGSVHGTESIWLGGSRDYSFSGSSNSDMLKAVFWLIETEQQLNGDALHCNVGENTDLNSLLNQAGAALGVAGVVLGIAAL
jgi:hypothetical protein